MASKTASKTTEISFNIPSREEYLKRFKGRNTEVNNTSESSVKPAEPAETAEIAEIAEPAKTAVKALVEKPDLSFDIPTKEEYSKRFESSKTEGFSGISPEEKSQVKPCDKPCVKTEETSKEKKNIKDSSFPFPRCYSGVSSVEPRVKPEGKPQAKLSIFESKFLSKMEKTILPENIKVVMLNLFEILATQVSRQKFDERIMFHNEILLSTLSRIESYYNYRKNTIQQDKSKFTLEFKYSVNTVIGKYSYENPEVELDQNHPIMNVIIKELINLAKNNNYIIKNDSFDSPNFDVSESCNDWMQCNMCRTITFVKTDVKTDVKGE